MRVYCFLSATLAVATLSLATPINPINNNDNIATSPNPALFNHNNHLAERSVESWIADTLKPLWDKVVSHATCTACTAGLVGVKSLTYLSTPMVLKAAEKLCIASKKLEPEMCSGIVNIQGSALIQAVKNADLTKGDGKLICATLLQLCPYPKPTSGSLKFPKPKPINATAPARSGKTFNVVHLSDWHYDPHYVVGSEAACNLPMCCRSTSTPPGQKNITRPASAWGDYQCDAPLQLGQDMLRYITTTIPDISFGILTGDLPPHDIWLPTTPQGVSEAIHASNKVIKNAFDSINANVFPAIGNHESSPTNLFPTYKSESLIGGDDLKWMYNALKDDWNSWLTSGTPISDYGTYVVSPKPGFKIVSLNTQFCYVGNFYLLEDTKDVDPNGQLQWLISVLQTAEDQKEKVWIIGHVAPGLSDCLVNWSHLYYEIIQRYAPHVVVEQFFGHTHYDEFQLFYQDTKNRSSLNAISTAWLAPSVAPLGNLNPGFRSYEIDDASFQVMESRTYVADMDKVGEWDPNPEAGNGPNWHLEYSAREAYGIKSSSTKNDTIVEEQDKQPLDAKWWHSVTDRWAKEEDLFQKFFLYRQKSSKLFGTCDIGCRERLTCDARAGSSDLVCSHINPFFKREMEEMEKRAESNQGLFGDYEHPWQRKICGLHVK